MDEESNQIEELEQIFLCTLDPLKVDEATSFIVEQIKNPQFILALLSLSDFTDNEKVLLQCSIQCCHAIETHWKNLFEDFQQKIFNQLLYLINNTKYPSYFPRCIGFIINRSSLFHPQLADYMKELLNSPNFEELMSTNSVIFNSFFKIFIETYFICDDVRQIDFSPLMIHIMENPGSFSPQIRTDCLTFLTAATYVLGKSKNEELSLNFEKYNLCYRCFCNMQYDDIFVAYWSSFFEFVDSDVLSQEEIDQIFQKAYQIIIDPETESNQKVLILSIYSGKLQYFQRDFISDLFEICFNTCNQILNEDGIFPVDYLNLFEPFLDLYITEDEEEVLDQEFISSLYSFVKDQITSEKANESICTTSLAVLNVFMTDSPDSIEKDFQFFDSFINQCIDSNVPILQEMCCYLLENSKLIKSESLKYKFSKIVPSLIHKIVTLISDEKASHDARFKAINSLFSLYDIASSNNDNYNSPYFEGLFDQIGQSQNLFSRSIYDLFVSCQTISIFLDRTVTDEQLVTSYQFAQEVLTSNKDDALASNKDDVLMAKCFILLKSIIFSNYKLNRNIDFDYSFTLPVIQYILTEKKDSSELILSSFLFINYIIMVYKRNAVEFECSCIDLIIPFLAEVEKTSLKIESVKIVSLSSKYSSNEDAANLIIGVIFKLMESDRIEIVKEVYLNAKKIVKLLNSDNLHQLFEYSMNIIYNDDNKSLIKESLNVIKKIVKYYVSSSHEEEDTSLIDTIHKLIKDFIDKNLRYQNEKNPLKVYYCLISNFCDLITLIWKIPSENNNIFFEFFLDYLQTCFSYFDGKNIEEIDIDKFKFDQVIACLGEGIKTGAINDQNLVKNLIELIPPIASPQLSTVTSFDLKQNICFLLNQILKIDFNVVAPFVDQFLLRWFQECIEIIKIDKDSESVDNSSILLCNISFLFFEIYGKTKPSFPSSQAENLLEISIENFPPMNRNCLEYTKSMLDSILSNFLSKKDIDDFDTMIHNEDNEIDMIKIYSSLALALVRLLKLSKEELNENRDIDDEMIEKVQQIVKFLMSQDKQIEIIVQKDNSE